MRIGKKYAARELSTILGRCMSLYHLKSRRAFLQGGPISFVYVLVQRGGVPPPMHACKNAPKWRFAFYYSWC